MKPNKTDILGIALEPGELSFEEYCEQLGISPAQFGTIFGDRLDQIELSSDWDTLEQIVSSSLGHD